MTEIQFYHLTSTPLERALSKLLEKALQGGFRICVMAGSEERAEALNTLLWTYDPASFLPHGTAKDADASAQPVYIAAGNENPNQADLLLVTDGSQVTPDAACKRILDIFDGADEMAASAARSRWKKYQDEGRILSYVKQSAAGTWEKKMD